MRKIIRYLVLIFAVFFLFLMWYKATYSMDKIESRQINSPNSKFKLFIASQGSEYKNKVVEKVIQHFRNDSIFIRIEDVSALGKISVEKWNAIVILHTWEITKPEENANLFVDNHYDKNKMFVVATSGSGDNRIANTDGITGASQLEDVDKDAKEIIKWIENKLNTL